MADTATEIRKAIMAKDELAGLIYTQLRPAGPGALPCFKVSDLITHLFMDGDRQNLMLYARTTYSNMSQSELTVPASLKSLRICALFASATPTSIRSEVDRRRGNSPGDDDGVRDRND